MKTSMTTSTTTKTTIKLATTTRAAIIAYNNVTIPISVNDDADNYNYIYNNSNGDYSTINSDHAKKSRLQQLH